MSLQSVNSLGLNTTTLPLASSFVPVGLLNGTNANQTFLDKQIGHDNVAKSQIDDEALSKQKEKDIIMKFLEENRLQLVSVETQGLENRSLNVGEVGAAPSG